MKLWSRVLPKLAELYESSAAGKHGGGKLDFQPTIEELLSAAGCHEGESRELAERDLKTAAEAGVIALVPIHRRDPNTFGKVRLAPENEAAFYQWIGQPSPSARRERWSALFREAADWTVPERFGATWRDFCAKRSDAAVHWRGMKPFDREDLEGSRTLLLLLPRLLAWEGRHLVRWASRVICGHSKTLEKRQRTLESLIAEATAGAAPTFESLGILPVPAGVTFHGPLRLQIGGEWRDFRGLHGPTTLSGADMARITGCECEAARCVTVENGTPFRSLAALSSGELLIFTSYPNEATLGLLAQLRSTGLEFWHFGDTDPDGFQILADLRERSGLSFQALKMEFRAASKPIPLSPRERILVEELIPRMPAESEALRQILAANDRGDYEQETLGPPALNRWPFYPP